MNNSRDTFRSLRHLSRSLTNNFYFVIGFARDKSASLEHSLKYQLGLFWLYYLFRRVYKPLYESKSFIENENCSRFRPSSSWRWGPTLHKYLNVLDSSSCRWVATQMLRSKKELKSIKHFFSIWTKRECRKNSNRVMFVSEFVEQRKKARRKSRDSSAASL